MVKIKRVSFLLLFLIAVGLNIHPRLIPAYFPQLKREALINIENNILKEAKENTEQMYPDLNPLIKDKIIREILKQKKKNKPAFEKIVAQKYKGLKARYQNQNNQTYLSELDPYCWMRFTKLVLENGYPGNKREGNDVYDTFMLAPEGKVVRPQRFLFYLSAYLYRIIHLFFSNLSVEKFLFYLPIFFSLIFFTTLYLFCRDFFSEITGMFAIIFTGLAPVSIFRSSAGWFDTDVLNLLFPLLVVWCVARALRSKTFLKNILLSLLASFFLALYAYTWLGWWFIYLAVFVFFVFALLNRLYLYFRDFPVLKKSFFSVLVSLFTFLLGSIFFCLSIARIQPFSFSYNSLRQHLGLGKSIHDSIWPNTYYTVSELQSVNFSSISSYTGGGGCFLFWPY